MIRRMMGKTIRNWIKAGADLFVTTSPKLKNTLDSLLSSGELSENMLSGRLQRQLMAKNWVQRVAPIKGDSMQFAAIKRQFYQASLILARDDSSQIPFTQLANKHFLLLSLGEPLDVFADGLRNYAPINHIRLGKSRSGRWQVPPLSQLREFNPIIFAIHQDSVIDTILQKYFSLLTAKYPVVGVNFGSLEATSQATPCRLSFTGLPRRFQSAGTRCPTSVWGHSCPWQTPLLYQ